MSKILCSVATRGRYYTTLPMVLMAIANQTRSPDLLVVFDDNDEPKDLREDPMYLKIFQTLDAKGIPWEWKFAERKGQHHIHQKANRMGYEWVWRVDDDAVPEPNVLAALSGYAFDGVVGAVGGAILTPPYATPAVTPTGLIENIDNEPNIQWAPVEKTVTVEHLHCSFLYRAGVYDFNLGLSRVAHREETLFTYGLHQRGYRLFVVPNATTWHLKSPTGGIRSETREEMYHEDERIFRNFMAHKDNTIVVLNCGMGDHVVFSHVLPKIKNPVVFGCYPEIIPCRSIAEAVHLFGNVDHLNIYGKMDQWRWTESLEKAFEKLYLP